MTKSRWELKNPRMNKNSELVKHWIVKWIVKSGEMGESAIGLNKQGGSKSRNVVYVKIWK